MIMALTTQPQHIEIGLSTSAPESLKYLADLDELIIDKIVKAKEVLSKNKYAILNKEEQQIFYVEEETIDSGRWYNPVERGYHLRLTDNNQLEIMRFTRDFKWLAGCCWCGEGCSNFTIKVEHPVGNEIGKITTGNAMCGYNIKFLDKEGNHLYSIWDEQCACQAFCCTRDVDFPITDPSLTTRIGNISKVWKGCCADLLQADRYHLTFPAYMSIDEKLLMLGGVFMVAYLIVEQQND